MKYRLEVEYPNYKGHPSIYLYELLNGLDIKVLEWDGSPLGGCIFIRTDKPIPEKLLSEDLEKWN